LPVVADASGTMSTGTMTVVLALALALAAAIAEPVVPVHGGLSVGIGTAYDVVGVRGEIGGEHFGAFLGTGLMTTGGTYSEPGASISFGARWYRGVRCGWFASLNFTYTWSSAYTKADVQGANGPTNPDDLFTAGIAAGYRFLARGFFLELGAGGGWYRHQNGFSCNISCPTPLPERGEITRGLFPDVVVGFGFDL
jgi:hypothetical protein